MTSIFILNSRIECLRSRVLRNPVISESWKIFVVEIFDCFTRKTRGKTDETRRVLVRQKNASNGPIEGGGTS